MRVHRGWGAALLAGAAVVAALGPVLWISALPAGAFTSSVNIEDKAGPGGEGLFDPSVVTINVGSKVLWTNKTSTRHTVTSDPGSVSFDSGDLKGPGGQFEWRFNSVGTFTYHCTHHPKMVGRVEVVDPNAPTTTTTGPPTTTTTAPPTTTTTAPATTTTAPPTTTSTIESRPAFGVLPPTTTAPAPPPPTAPSTTTSVPSTTTTTTAPPTTPTSAAPLLAGGGEGASSSSTSAPPPTTATTGAAAGDKTSTAAGPPASTDGELDVGAVLLVSALVAVGAFGAWTLIRVRPGRI